MVSDPSLEVQIAIVTLLHADAAVRAIVDRRIFDTVPRDPSTGQVSAKFPHVTLGEGQVIPDRGDCLEGAELFLSLHAWSRAVGYPEVKRLAKAVTAALDDVELTIEGFRIVSILLDDIQYLRDPDGITSHAAMTFHALTEPADELIEVDFSNPDASGYIALFEDV
jgi:hypothetical protein